MNKPMLWVLTSAVCAVAAIPTGAKAQNSSLVAQPPITFSSIGYVPGVQLTGTATWRYGSDHQTGTATLKAFANGGSQMSLQLSGGPRVETQNPLTDDQRNCTWSGADGVAHNVADHNCWLSTVWFLPQLTLQPGAGAADTVITHVTAPDGKDFLHQERYPQGAKTQETAKLLAQVSASDVQIDPETGYPQILFFNSHPDNNAGVNIATEIHFSDYRSVLGVAIPFHIQKLINHSLVLDLQITEAKLQ